MSCIDMSAAITSFLPKDVGLLEESVQCLAEQMQNDQFRDLFAGLAVPLLLGAGGGIRGRFVGLGVRSLPWRRPDVLPADGK